MNGVCGRMHAQVTLLSAKNLLLAPQAKNTKYNPKQAEKISRVGKPGHVKTKHKRLGFNKNMRHNKPKLKLQASMRLLFQ